MNVTKNIRPRRISVPTRRERATPDAFGPGAMLAADGCGLQPIDLPELILNADAVITHGRAAVRAVGRSFCGVKAWVGSTTGPVLNRLPLRFLPLTVPGRGRPAEPPQPPPRDPPNTLRISVIFAFATYALLECIADRNGISMPQALRDSIVLRNYLERAIDDGGRVLIDRGGRLTELVLA